MPTVATAQPRIASREEWLTSRRELREKEQELTDQRDALSASRRKLPMVKIEKSNLFDGPNGKASLLDLRRFLALIVMTGVSGLYGLDARADEPPPYEVYAVRYGTAPGCPVSFLVQGAEKDRKVDLAFTFWVLKVPGGRTVLVDAGFYRPQFFEEFKGIADYTRPDRAIGRLGIKPEEVTDVIITHMHSDHFDGVDLFPKATVWIQKDEFNHYTREVKPPSGKGAPTEQDDVSALMKLNAEGRVRLVDGDAKEIIPGVTVYTGGKHTFASQYVGVNTKSGRMVVASDNVYLYENIDKHVPITATLDAKSNLAAQDRMKQLATNPRFIIPGHDPEVFVRFPKPGNGVARIE